MIQCARVRRARHQPVLEGARETEGTVRKRLFWAIGRRRVPVPLGRLLVRRHAEHARATGPVRAEAAGPVRPRLLGRGLRLRGRRGRHRLARGPVPAIGRAASACPPDPWQHAARDRLDDRPGADPRRGDGADDRDLGPRRRPAARRAARHRPGFQWWWGFEYTDPDMATDYGDDVPIRTADVLVIPEDRVVRLARGCRRADLRGHRGGRRPHGDPLVLDAGARRKQDVTPGRTNHILMQADHAGRTRASARSSAGCSTAGCWSAWWRSRPTSSTRGPRTRSRGGRRRTLARQGMDLFLNPLSGAARA